MDSKIREQVLAEIAAEKAEARRQKKERLKKIQAFKDAMTVEQKVQFMNTPYKNLPEELREGMVHWPQMFNFVRYTKPNIGRQKETFAARLIKYRDKYALTQQGFCDICNELASKYDLPAKNGQRAQRVRITTRDLIGYENYNICPKIDKMTIIAEAMGVSVDYFAGYGSENRHSKNELLEAKYRKRRSPQVSA